MMMKKLALVAGIAASLSTGAFAAEPFEFVTAANGNGFAYIQINEDLDSFSFHSDFKSIGNSGKVGYYLYPDGLSGKELADYVKATVAAGDAEFAKKIDSGLVDLGALKAGDRVGFFLDRNNGDTVSTWDFAEKHGVTYIDFTKNGVGSSKDEWMSISDPVAKVHAPAGAPLPGVLAVLLVGGMGAGALKLRRRRA